MGTEARRYEPRMGADERAALLADWRRALERARGWVTELPERRREAARRGAPVLGTP